MTDGGRYGVEKVTRFTPDPPRETTFVISAIDLLARGLTPRPFFSERRRMEQLSPVRLGLYLILRAAYYRAPDNRVSRALWRFYRG